jgi:prepilin-type N-terminal cleavage/methylation domain-containing protein
MSLRRRSGFTLVELMVAMAIIGMLIGLLFPAISGVRKKARLATAQGAFSQWANGVTRYKQTYGFYPSIGTKYDTTGDSLHSLESGTIGVNFIMALSGKNPEGSILTDTARKAFNRNGEEFCAFAKDDFEDYSTNTATTGVLMDRFGNHNIRIIFDTDSTGTIKAVAGLDAAKTPPDLSSIASGGTGIPARIIIFTSDLDIGSLEGLEKGDVADVIAIQ